MAEGGSHHNHKGMNNGNRLGSLGKPYGLMLLLAFVAALLGVMVLHKLRERRIFSLLVKEKDTQLISVQFLLQKEREYGKEMKRKSEEMIAKIYSLRTQKMELNRRIIELQSTIDSLKDEQKVMESALEEKQNEMKMQRDEKDSSKDNSELIDLGEILKQKGAEIEDLRHRLEYPTKVWSVSTDDPSNPPVNLTDTSSVAEKDKTDSSLSKEKGGALHESTNFVDGENAARVEDRSEKSVGYTNSREMRIEHLQKSEISHDEGFKTGGAIEGKGIVEADGGHENIANSTEPIVDSSGTVQKLRDDNSGVKDGIEHTITGEKELGKLQYSKEVEKQEVQVLAKGGKKLEMLEYSFDVGSRLRGKHGHVSRTKAKGWRALAKHRDSENSGLASMRSRRFYGFDQDELRSTRESRASDSEIEKSEGKGTIENPVGLQETMDSMDAKFPKKNTDDAHYTKNRDENANPNRHVHQENEMLKRSYNSPDEVFGNNSLNKVANVSGDAEKKRSDEVRQLEEEATDIQQKLTRPDNYVQGNIATQVKDSDGRK